MKQSYYNKLLAGTVIAAFLPFLMVEALPGLFYRVLDTPSYLLFHNVVEFFSVMVSLSIFGVWFTYNQSKDRRALFLSAAFLAIGLLDFMHALGYAGMPVFITPNSANKSTQYWIAARMLTAGAFLASAYIYPGTQLRWLSKNLLMTAALAVPLLVFSGITFFPSYVPATFVEGGGLTVFKKVSEYVIICLLLLAFAAYWKRRAAGDRLSVLFLAAFILCIFSELVFAVYRSVFDSFNVLGHLYKVAAFCLIYGALFASAVNKPYEKLAESNEKLRQEIAGHLDAKERLRVVSAYNRNLIETSLDPLVTIGPDGKITDVNAATEKITGRTRQELVATDFCDYFTEPAKASAGYEQVFREGILHDYPLEIRHRDGHSTSVLYNASVYRDEAGSVIGVFAAARDITEKKRDEEAVAAERQRFNDVLETLPSYIILLNADYSVTFANRVFRERFGESRGRRCYEYLFGRNEPCETCETFTVFKTGAPHHWEWLGPDGRTYDIHDFPFTDRDGSQCILETGIDITERKRAEEELRRANLYNRSLIEASLDPLVTISPDGKITDVNEATIKVTGVLRENLTGTDFSNYFTEPGEAREGYLHVLESGFVTDYPLTIRRKDGKLTDVLYNASVYKDPEGKIIGVFAAARDITERKKAEAEIRKLNAELEQRVAERTAELEAANRELEAFAYSVSHDLRAPLRAVDGYTRILLEDYRSVLDAEGKRVCSVISDSAREMGKLIDDLLAFSRIGRATMQPSAVDMAAMAQSVYFEITTPEGRERIAFHVDPLPSVVGDQNLLRQVWRNLLSNAVKFSSKKERAEIGVSALQQGGEIVYCVRDNGAGFDMRYADKLFGVFQRLHSTKEFEGTGVGLAIVQRIILRHGGRIWGEGETGRGATFCFTLGKGDHAWTNQR